MRLNTPRWWYRKSGSALAATLLKPLAALYADQTARRLASDPGFDPGVPVISIGNLTVGGSGKTPIVREILHMLARNGIDAHGLSRGYGATQTGPLLVDPDEHTAEDVGDEPLMLAQDHPVWISRDRAEGARAAVAAGARLLVLDDAHQNPSVRKTRSVVVVDGETRDGAWPFGDGSVVPAGPMREPLATGLARADAVILLMPSDLATPDPDLLALFGDLPVRIARLEPVRAPSPGPKLGFAGIAKPWRVEQSLKAAGADLKGFRAYPDHAVYSEEALDALAREADRLGAGLITTEKDWVRLPPAWRRRIEAWPVRARFEDEQMILDLLPRDPDDLD
jgi:tetraacyldisaccharide 4'-kinase